MEEMILKVATGLFLEKGFAATSTTEIAKKAGCNQALVHYYFRTKDRLFEAIFQSKIKFFIGPLLEIGKEDIPYEHKLAKKIESHFDAVHANPKLPLFFLSELSSNPGRIEAIKKVLGDLPKMALKQMEDELNAEIEKGTVKPMSIEHLMLTIVSLNIMVFLAEPMFKIMTNQSDDKYREFVKQRKKEHVRIVLNNLKPE
jgi:AcrR family transcriptional regulator